MKRLMLIILAMYQAALSVACGVFITAVLRRIGKGGMQWDNVVLMSLIVLPSMVYCALNVMKLVGLAPKRLRESRHLSGTSYVLAAVLTTALLYLAAFHTTRNSSAACLTHCGSMGPGQTAPAMRGIDQNGRAISLGALRGKYVLLDFWATWCIPCLPELENVAELQEKYSSRNLVILGINVDDDVQRFTEFMAGHPVEYSQIHDADRKIRTAYGVGVLPTLYLVGADGRIVGSGPGKTMDALIEKHLGVE